MSLFDISKLEKDLEDLEKQTLEEDFWKDSKTSSKVLSKIKRLKSKCSDFKEIEKEIENLEELVAVSYTHLTLPTNSRV